MEVARMKMPTRIRTQRLSLRKHELKDLEAFQAFLSDPVASRYMAFTPEQKTQAGARQMLEYVIGSYQTATPICSLTIADLSTDQYLGSCGANPDGKDIEIYYTVMPEHQGKGYATEAARALLNYLSATTESRLIAYVILESLPSVRVAERLGLIDAGPIRRKAVTGDQEHETLSGRKYVLPK
ncbi:GNAT family N-acetyltransferase [Cyanobium sp. LEGE 06113]|uniref:GNAT family N-acetyltransferase n=1 Tax=Cyanobium sp. LEGE 06113 TaxID=1297573 RepID=UPI00351C2C4A